MSSVVTMFIIFVLTTLVITAWAAGRNKTPRAFYSANRGITGFQNGWAVAGDYMSAASFLGISGLIAFYGFDGFMYSVGWLVAYLTVLLLVAEPLRNTGKYTLADVLSFRMLGGECVRWRPSPHWLLRSFIWLRKWWARAQPSDFSYRN